MLVAAEYFERYNAGDVAGVLGLFAPDATFSERWIDGGDAYTLEFFEMFLEWNAAQGSQLVDPVCSDPRPARVSCRLDRGRRAPR